MKNRITDTFDSLHARGRKALVVYLTAGDPDLPTSLAAAEAAVEAGADLLEIGVPFSDPVADGPVIQRAMGRALARGGGLHEALGLVRGVRRRSSKIPIVLFGYADPFLWDGLEATCQRISMEGADGLLVVDVPHEEAGEFRSAAVAQGLDWIVLLAPTTGAARAQSIAQQASGFIYMVSMMGVTGGELGDTSHLATTIAAVRRVTDVPVCVGFGVRDRASAERVAAVADGVVVGSAIVAALEGGGSDVSCGGPAAVAALVRALRAGVDAGRVTPAGSS